MVSLYLVRFVLFIAVRQRAVAASALAAVLLRSVSGPSVNGGVRRCLLGRRYAARAVASARGVRMVVTALPWWSMKWVILAIAFLPSTANALEIRYTRQDAFSSLAVEAEALLLSGKIISGDYAKLVQVVSDDIPRYLNSVRIILASPGGDVQEAIKIGRFVRSTYREVVVGPHFGPCVSACFLIFASALTRLAGPELVAFHRPYIAGEHLKGLSVTDAETKQLSLNMAVKEYLSALQIPIQLIDTMLSRRSTELYWLSGQDLLERVGRHARGYERFLITRCGLDTGAESEYFSGKSVLRTDILRHLIEVRNCAETLNAAETLTFVTMEGRELRQTTGTRFSAMASAHLPLN